jgi:hypothetical protein
MPFGLDDIDFEIEPRSKGGIPGITEEDSNKLHFLIPREYFNPYLKNKENINWLGCDELLKCILEHAKKPSFCIVSSYCPRSCITATRSLVNPHIINCIGAYFDLSAYNSTTKFATIEIAHVLKFDIEESSLLDDQNYIKVIFYTDSYELYTNRLDYEDSLLASKMAVAWWNNKRNDCSPIAPPPLIQPAPQIPGAIFNHRFNWVYNYGPLRVIHSPMGNGPDVRIIANSKDELPDI